MNKTSLIIFGLFLLLNSISAISIHEIQYTTNLGDYNTYPSNYAGEVIQTSGIVTGINYNNYGYFIADGDGAWNGIFVYDNDYLPAIGDSILITAEVYEYYGWTELKNIESLEIISSNNTLPNPALISTAEVSSEQYESVLVQLSNVIVTQAYNDYSEFTVDDGSGEADVSTGFINFENHNLNVFDGLIFNSISGLISSRNNSFKIHPRGFDDVSLIMDFIISIDGMCFHDTNFLSVPITLTSLDNIPIENHQFNFSYNPEIVSYANFNTDGTISENGEVSQIIDDNNVQINFTGNAMPADFDILLKLNFIPNGIDGYTDLLINSATINGEGVGIDCDIVSIYNNNDPIGDTLTVIQRPILSVPEIVVPTEQMQILCDADASTSNWQANLFFNDIILELPIISTNYDSNSELWTLTTEIPTPNLYELYHLQVSASNGILDIAKNSVQLIPQEKDEYYFIHVTDTHLPTHSAYWDSNPEVALTDTTTMIALRNIINDVNLLNPEFVLLTGDLLNEGELEDFGNGRVYTKAKRILGEFEVPVYLVSGNHDIGGWQNTPVQNGSARRNWWRFFGWKSLEFNEPYTQNYTFDYNNILFLGMEAYDNYDSWNFDIYEEDSFIPEQLDWLDNQLQNATGFDAKVLFYHYDFSNQINLNSLGVDMSLWGHTHSNHNDYTHPFDIATRAACSSGHSYRVIKVNSNNEFQPFSTSHANDYGVDNLTVDYFPSNEGLADSVTAIIHSNQNIDFENIKLKFIMPSGNTNYEVFGGTLYQIDTSGEFNICYVNANLPANSEIAVTVTTNTVEFGDVDGNGEIQAYDASLVLQNVVGLVDFTETQITNADVDGNGQIQAFDASLILQFVVGIIDEFPVE